MSQNCTYKFTGPDGKEKLIIGLPAFKAYLASGGLEFLRGEAKSSKPRQSETPEFKRWFGNSKVLNSKGEPLVVYHGTGERFSTFEPSDSGWYGSGVYLTDSRETASSYSGGKGGVVMPVYVRMENPYYYKEVAGDSFEDGSNFGLIRDVLSAPAAEKLIGHLVKNDDPALVKNELRDALEKLGHDGIIVDVLASSDGEREYIAFRPEQIKSATKNDGSFDPTNPDITRSVARPAFYSQLQRTIEGLPDRIATQAAPQWKLWLDANAPKFGIKKDEIEWSGLKDWLTLQGKAKVTKGQIGEYLADSGVRVRDVVLGLPKRAWRLTTDDGATSVYSDDDLDEMEADRAEFGGAVAEISVNNDGDGRYREYTVPGGQNYRELLITLPDMQAPATVRKELEDINEIDRRLTEDEASRRAELEKLIGNGQRKYQSSHWDVPGILAHLRVDDRVDADGKRVLFVNEVQSDHGQDGKRKGFATSNEKKVRPNERTEFIDSMKSQAIEKMKASGVDKEAAANVTASLGHDGLARMTGRVAEYEDLLSRELADRNPAVPPAPFVTDTKSWVALAIKRATLMAVEGGYDKVAFITGAQAADLYDLSKSIESIGYDPRSGRLQAFDKSRTSVFDETGVKAEQLEDHIEKEVAQRLLATELVMGKHLLSGENIKVGGDGMRVFYDSIVPQVVNDILKKVGGGKVDRVDLPNQKDGWHITPPEQNVHGKWMLKSSDYNSKGQLFDTEALAQEELRRRSGVLSQPGFAITPAMREKIGSEGLPLFSRTRQTETPEFKEWSNGLPVFESYDDGAGARGVYKLYHATPSDTNILKPGGKDRRISGPAIWLSPYPELQAAAHNIGGKGNFKGGVNVMPVYARLARPLLIDDKDMLGWARKVFANDSSEFPQLVSPAAVKELTRDGEYDSIIFDGEALGWGDKAREILVFESDQVKSAIGNVGTFGRRKPTAKEIESLTLDQAQQKWQERNGGALTVEDAELWQKRGDVRLSNVRDTRLPGGYILNDLLKSDKKLSLWDKTVGSMYNIAQKNPAFKAVFDAGQDFINDISLYATHAANLAPRLIRQIDGVKDVFSGSPISPEDAKAVSAPVFDGTLRYMRDDEGNPVRTNDVGKAGIVWRNEELRTMFGLNDEQISLYREFRAATNKSVNDLASSQMARLAGKDGLAVRDAVMDAPTARDAARILGDHFAALALANPARANSLQNKIRDIKEVANTAQGLIAKGYAPLSRFGEHTVYVTRENGSEQVFFGMYESEREANKVAREMAEEYPDAQVETGRMSKEEFKLYRGINPESLELFGGALGLDDESDDIHSQVFQEFLRKTKNNKSAMKHMIERKGVEGFSEDAARVLASFVYSNSRQISTNYNAQPISLALASPTFERNGDVKDAAIQLIDHIQTPKEGAAKIQAFMFSQYIGGSISSAIINATQPFMMTFPYLAQFGGMTKSAGYMRKAIALAGKGITNDPELERALTRAKELGIVKPHEAHHIMGQAMGKGVLQHGDGTKFGDAMAKVHNSLAKVSWLWAAPFSIAETFNREVTFIAAYSLARDQEMADPMKFAQQAINETQGVQNAGNKPAWARSTIGGALFVFKSYSVAYVEFISRLYGNGPEGKRAAMLALGMLFLMAGFGGLPFEGDLENVINGIAQRVLHKNFIAREWLRENLSDALGDAASNFVIKGASGLPGAPIDFSGRTGLGHLIPGSGVLNKKPDYASDIKEVAGPSADFAARVLQGVAMLSEGNLVGAATSITPLAARNIKQAADMAATGSYNDAKGRKVVDVDAIDVAVKAIGFQPGGVAKIQSSIGVQQQLISLYRLRVQELSDKMVAARLERDPSIKREKIAAVESEKKSWNENNPGEPIELSAESINGRVRQAMTDKAKRIEKTAPREIRNEVKRQLASERD